MKRGRGKTIGLSIAILAPALILAFAWTFKDALVDWWYRIPVTRTWGDLRSQRPIDLGNDVIVRLGIEATRCPQWSGVLVYCLTEGYSGEIPEGEGEPLGPLLVSMRRESRGEEYPSEVHFKRKTAQLQQDSTLFARTIPIPRPGRYEVQVSTSDGRMLRKAIIHGTTERFHPWMTLNRSPRLTVMDRRTLRFPSPVTNREGAAAIPDWNGWQPYLGPESKQSLAGPELPLPGLFPRSPQEEITLALEGDQLLLTSKHRIVANSPYEHFLCRWWVNGEPYLSDQLTRKSLLEDKGGRLMLSDNLRLELDFDPARIGAGSGDHIGLQLLYLDHGWEFMEHGDRIEKLVPQNISHRALLTNRVEFTAP